MRSFGKVMLAALALVAGHSATARAQEAFTLDTALATQGSKVWKAKGCDVCHTIGKGKRAGPDLAGVTSRRSSEWLTSWLKNPPEMAKNDDVGKQLAKEANGVIMPNLKLTDSEITNLIHYMGREPSKK